MPDNIRQGMIVSNQKGFKTSLDKVDKKYKYIFVFGKKYNRFIGVENYSEF